MKVLIIPEHPSNDHYILKPLFTRLLRNIGSTSVRVEVCQDPVLGNVDQALRLTRLKEIVEQYVGMTDIFILCVDRDGIVSRRKTLDHIEKELGSLFLAENAWEELETWALAGLGPPRRMELGRGSLRNRCQGAIFRALRTTTRTFRLTRRWPQDSGRGSLTPHLRHPTEMPRGL